MRDRTPGLSNKKFAQYLREKRRTKSKRKKKKAEEFEDVKKPPQKNSHSKVGTVEQFNEVRNLNHSYIKTVDKFIDRERWLDAYIINRSIQRVLKTNT